ncbi:conserved hypothetical protein [Histoplasma mississippiense (nom. inval.)]|uniref:conserved hypothetical protein n=1 Tax=Ajellomyces capsulatus (strain NAm1 / WU24) TaxID=2059318 RepID=UPI000157CE1A|nr:conserved hypothetical protein [Histoplasma mississippiense (nom. inval.)]EDN09993.1 conserved hypothetical protein [Histoplasma mississippiense (nom. inval.)]
MPSNLEIASSFIRGAPPGELSDVVADIKALTPDGPALISSLAPAFEKYNEEQLATVKLPGGSEEVIVSSYNKLDGNRYYDVQTQTSFQFDHVTQTASSPQSYVLESRHSDLMNGRYRAIYTVPAPSTDTITGTIHINVHYYEDGNVSLNTTKPISISLPVNSSADTVIKRIAAAERAQQLELSDAFSRLSEGAFKGLRRQLPITRQKVEWEKVGGYRLGQDISGGKGRLQAVPAINLSSPITKSEMLPGQILRVRSKKRADGHFSTP